MNSVNVNIFFDESGKKEDQKPRLMGGLLIPCNIYETESFKDYNNRLKENEFYLHWKKYSGDNEQKNLIIDMVVSLFKKYSSLFCFNVINYIKPEKVDNQAFEDMVYTKLPERIIYGLLRHYGSDITLNTNIYIEYSTEYEKNELSKTIKRQLNIQSIYRGKNFKIISCDYRKKNTEIGVELTDLILGIIRTIIKNCSTSRTERSKNNLVLELLKIKEFYLFMSNIRYFEWNHTYELTMVDFKYYLQMFLSNQEDWIGYLEMHK